MPTAHIWTEWLITPHHEVGEGKGKGGGGVGGGEGEVGGGGRKG